MKEIIKDVFSITWPTVVIVLSIAIILRIFYLKQNKKKFVLHEEVFLLIFLTYILVLYELLTFQDVEISGTNFMPFKEILRYDFNTPSFYKQVVGNILLFVPFGYFVSRYIKLNKLGSIFIITLSASAIIETVQYFIGRCFDIDDIILNVVGGILGFLIFTACDAIKKKLPKLFQKDFLYNILSIIVIILIVLYFLGIYRFGF